MIVMWLIFENSLFIILIISFMFVYSFLLLWILNMDYGFVRAYLCIFLFFPITLLVYLRLVPYDSAHLTEVKCLGTNSPFLNVGIHIIQMHIKFQVDNIHTSIFVCSSALAPGAGIALARSRWRVFLTPSAPALPATLSLQSLKLGKDFRDNIIAQPSWQYKIKCPNGKNIKNHMFTHKLSSLNNYFLNLLC